MREKMSGYCVRLNHKRYHFWKWACILFYNLNIINYIRIVVVPNLLNLHYTKDICVIKIYLIIFNCNFKNSIILICNFKKLWYSKTLIKFYQVSVIIAFLQILVYIQYVWKLYIHTFRECREHLNEPYWYRDAWA